MDSTKTTQTNESQQSLTPSSSPVLSKQSETRFNLLGKMVFDIANTDLLPQKDELQHEGIEESEGQSIVEKFLIHICPIFEEEISAKIRDMGKWRSGNLAKISHIANMKLLVALSQMHLAVHPRVMLAVIEKGSLTEDPKLIEMWANYLVSACTFAQDDERYVGYARFLESLSPGQARLFYRICRSSIEDSSANPERNYEKLDENELFELTEADELSELRFDLMNLESLGLIEIRMQMNAGQVEARATNLGMNFYNNIEPEEAVG